MNKYLFLTLLACLLVAVIPACGANPQPAPPATATDLPATAEQPTASTVPATLPQPATSPTSVSPTLSPTAVSSTASLDGAALVQSHCTECHSLNRVKRTHGTVAEWTKIVEKMVEEGLEVTAEEKQAIITYLAQTYP